MKFSRCSVEYGNKEKITGARHSKGQWRKCKTTNKTNWANCHRLRNHIQHKLVGFSTLVETSIPILGTRMIHFYSWTWTHSIRLGINIFFNVNRRTTLWTFKLIMNNFYKLTTNIVTYMVVGLATKYSFQFQYSQYVGYEYSLGYCYLPSELYFFYIIVRHLSEREVICMWCLILLSCVYIVFFNAFLNTIQLSNISIEVSGQASIQLKRMNEFVSWVTCRS